MASPLVLPHFNPRSRMGSDEESESVESEEEVFQSTPPAWGATSIISVRYYELAHFNPRPPHGERLAIKYYYVKNVLFQSTPPAWGATYDPGTKKMVVTISIHAPRMGSDERPAWCIHRACYFNPRSRMGSDWTPSNTKHLNKSFQSTLPHGERPVPVNRHAAAGTFQSTLPHGERRITIDKNHMLVIISIHAPAWGATLLTVRKETADGDFNPRSRMGSD